MIDPQNVGQFFEQFVDPNGKMIHREHQRNHSIDDPTRDPPIQEYIGELPNQECWWDDDREDDL